MIEYYWPLIYHLDAENIIDGDSMDSMEIPGSNRWRYVSTILLAIFCGDIL